MSWQDRVHRAAYTPNKGTRRFVFDTENVSRTTEKRTTAFQFPGVDDSYVQENGYGSRKYALRCFFTGDDCDKIATAFELVLLEPGIGMLEHPLYGTFNVVPFGRISRRDDLVTAANQAVVEVEFWTTTAVVYPLAAASPKNEVEQNIADFNEEQSKQYENTMILKNTQQQQELRGTVEGALAVANSYLSVPAQTTTEVAKEFRAWQQTINTGINVLVGNPALLAQQVSNLIQAPARAVVGIQNRILSYVDFMRAIFGSDPGSPGLAPGAQSSPSRQTQVANDWRTADMNVLNALVAMALSAIETEYRTKPEALSVADILLSELETVAAWREAGYAAFTGTDLGSRIEVVDDGRAWLYATQTIYVCAGYLVQLAFSLASERLMVLDRDRSVVDLAAELYGKIDDETINFVINSNDLSGSQILELERGTEILWYP